MKWIAVDYGEARTGLAECDPGEVIVTPITPQIEEKSMNKAAQAAADAAKARAAGGLVVGLPKNMDGSEGPRAEKSRALAELIERQCGLRPILWDERRSSVEAHAILHANGKRERKHKKTVDALAAALLLEGYLASRPAT